MKTFQQFQEETPDIKGIITRSGKKPLKRGLNQISDVIGTEDAGSKISDIIKTQGLKALKNALNDRETKKFAKSK